MSTIKLRLKRVDEGLLVRALITHPMDTGRKLDAETGQVIPAHYIKTLKLMHNGQIVVDSELSTAVSRDPYFAFLLGEGKSGDRIKLSWTDNLGRSDSAEVQVE